MRIRFGPFVLGLIGVNALLLIAVLTFFNQRIDRVPRSFLNRHILSGWSEERSFEALQKNFIELESATTQACLTTYKLNWADTPPLEWSQVTTMSDQGLDLRAIPWRIKFAPLSEPLRSTLCSVDEQTHNVKVEVNAQYERLASIIRSGPFLIETKFTVPSAFTGSYWLSLGLINGSSLVSIDRKALAYFPERYDSNRLIPIYLGEGEHTLSLTINSNGFTAVGIATLMYVGFMPQGQPLRQDLFVDPVFRTTGDLLLITLTCILAIILCLFERPLSRQRKEVQWLRVIAALLTTFALSRSLELDHVQSTLDHTWIQLIRAWTLAQTCFLSFTLVTHPLLALATFLLEYAPRSLTKEQGFRFRIPPVHKLEPYWPLFFIAVCGYFGCLWIKMQATTSYYKAAQQNLMLDPILNVLRVCGSGLVVLGFLLILIYYTRATEDAFARKFMSRIKAITAAGIALFFYSASYEGLLSRWLVSKSGANLSSLLLTMSVPFAIGTGIIYLAAQTFKKIGIFERITPESSLEIIDSEDDNYETLDRTKTEYNWMVINDLCGSSPLKATHPVIFTHMLLSILHKVHLDYFKNAVHFSETAGDAMLFALKTPTHCRRSDPTLEKIVRLYTLHKDGAAHLTRSSQVIRALLSLENRELYEVLTSIPERSNYKFRTLVTDGFYYYGLNHNVPNIDSRSIYSAAKSEKQIPEAKDGGFFVFPSLFATLQLCLPQLTRHFIEVSIPRNDMHPDLQRLIPKVVFKLPEESASEFENDLKELYGSQLFLQQAFEHKMGSVPKDYTSIDPKIEQWIKAVNECKTLDDLVSLVKTPPVTKNFLEKNQMIIAVCKCATAKNVWEYPELHERIKESLRALGVPAPRILEGIKSRDLEHAPKMLIKRFRDIDPLTRNRAARLLTIARTRNKHRPDEMESAEFLEEIWTIYLKTFHRFSVESHVEVLKCFSELLSSEKVRASPELISFLRNHSAPSLKSIGKSLSHNLESQTAP